MSERAELPVFALTAAARVCDTELCFVLIRVVELLNAVVSKAALILLRTCLFLGDERTKLASVGA